MEACLGVEREVVKVLDKFEKLRDQNVRYIDELLTIVRDAKTELQTEFWNFSSYQAGFSSWKKQYWDLDENLSSYALIKNIRLKTERMCMLHRDLHLSVSRVGKAVDRNFVSDYDSTSRDDIFTSPEQATMLNQVILQHFYRQGQLEIAETLAKEANLSKELTISKEPFQELNSILESLQKRDLGPALAWAAAHRDELNARGATIPMLVAQHLSNQSSGSSVIDGNHSNASHGQLGNNNIIPPQGVPMDQQHGILQQHSALGPIPLPPGTPPVPILPTSLSSIISASSSNSSNATPSKSITNNSTSLEMKLHRLQYVEILKKGRGNNRLEAIQYARQHFPRFVNGNEKDIATLMGALMYAGPKLEESPYAHLLEPRLWQEVADLFVRDACALMGLSVESPLAVAVNAGCTALPALLNIKQVMLQHAGVWGAKDELPIEIDLGANSRYHSIFACPILRQQTSDHNPPLRLTCGHCISRDALNKLSSGHKLKCPYCPVEQNPNDARQIVF